MGAMRLAPNPGNKAAAATTETAAPTAACGCASRASRWDHNLITIAQTEIAGILAADDLGLRAIGRPKLHNHRDRDRLAWLQDLHHGIAPLGLDGPAWHHQGILHLL